MFTIKKNSLSYRFLTLVSTNFRFYHKNGYGLAFLPRTFCGYYAEVLYWAFLSLLVLAATPAAIFNLVMFVDKPFHQQVIQFGISHPNAIWYVIAWSVLGMLLLMAGVIVGLVYLIPWITSKLASLYVMTIKDSVITINFKFFKKKEKKVDDGPTFWQTVKEAYHKRFCPFIQYEDHSDEQ